MAAAAPPRTKHTYSALEFPLEPGNRGGEGEASEAVSLKGWGSKEQEEGEWEASIRAGREGERVRQRGGGGKETREVKWDSSRVCFLECHLH